jgi:hypothetical protein
MFIAMDPAMQSSATVITNSVKEHDIAFATAKYLRQRRRRGEYKAVGIRERGQVSC